MQKNFDFSITALFICLMAWLFNITFTGRDKQDIINNDVIFYYSYLPATFIEHDPSLKFTDTLSNPKPNRYWHLTAENGGYYSKMSMGIAMLYSPFFALGHYSTLHSSTYKNEADGFSYHYKRWLIYGTLFYSFLALVLLRLLLLRYFERIAVGGVIIILGLGTNLYCYIVHDSLMSHAYSFFLFTAFLSLVVNWITKPSALAALGLGLVGGLIVLIRPTNCIIALAFGVYHVENWNELKNRVKLLLSNWFHVVIIIIGVALVWLPQILYWKANTDHYFYYSYGDEGFFFGRPHIWDTLLSWRKGLLVYSPLMALSFAGLLFLAKYAKPWKWTLWLFIPLNLYVISSWWCWWYGGSFGIRPLIDSYPLMAIPMCAAVSEILKARKWIVQFFTILMLFFIHLNIFQTWQYSTSLLHYDSMNKATYFKILLKTSWFDGYDQTISPPDYDNAKKGLPKRNKK